MKLTHFLQTHQESLTLIRWCADSKETLEHWSAMVTSSQLIRRGHKHTDRYSYRTVFHVVVCSGLTTSSIFTISHLSDSWMLYKWRSWSSEMWLCLLWSLNPLSPCSRYLKDMFLQMLVPVHKTTCHHFPEDHNLHSHCCENLKSLTVESLIAHVFAWFQRLFKHTISKH
jgi:hypothetical protein